MNAPAFNYPSWFKVKKKYKKRFCAKFTKVDNKDKKMLSVYKSANPFTNVNKSAVF